LTENQGTASKPKRKQIAQIYEDEPSGDEAYPKSKKARSSKKILEASAENLPPQEGKSSRKASERKGNRRQTAGSELTDTLTKLRKEAQLPGRIFWLQALTKSSLLTRRLACADWRGEA
jgi:hypothetical protein